MRKMKARGREEEKRGEAREKEGSILAFCCSSHWGVQFSDFTSALCMLLLLACHISTSMKHYPAAGP